MASNSRFRTVSEEEIEELLAGKNSKSTDRTIKHSTNTFRTFLRENGSPANFETFDKQNLNEKLRSFYASIKKTGKNSGEDGGMYKRNAFVSLRYGLNKYIKKEMGYDVCEDPEFETSKQVFLAVCSKLKKCGLAVTDHYPPIENEDLKLLYNGSRQTFNTNTPVGLQQKVWFEIMFYLCRRGRENLREMTVETFKICTDPQGREYVFQAIDEGDKNHTENDNPDDTIGEGTQGLFHVWCYKNPDIYLK